MKKLLFFLLSLCYCCVLSQLLHAQDPEEEIITREFEKTKQMIVMIKAESDGAQEFGAGIIVGRKKDEILIVTAYHLLHSGTVQADKVQVELRVKPGKYLEASILKFSNEETMDLALLSVTDLSRQGIDVCSLAFDRLNTQSTLKSGDGVFPLGNPNGTPWAMPVIADKIADILGNNISFQSSFITKGNSGGALVDTSAGIKGLVVADQPPFGRAVNIESIINTLSQWGFSVNLRTRDYKGQTPLHIAASKGDVNAIKNLLLSDCNNINQRDDHLATPLHFAAYSSSAVTQFLINSGADLNALDADGDPPLEWADETRNVGNVKLLVNAGAKWRRWSPLILAGIKGDLISVKNFLKDPRNINQKDDHGATPLHFFAAYATEEEVSLMVTAGAGINVLDEDHNPPIEWAAESGRIDIMKLLAKVGVKGENTTRQELLEAAVKKGQIDVVKFLRSKEADGKFDAWRWQNGAVLLTLAVENKQYQMLKYLLESGADVNEGSGSAVQSPIVYAVRNGQIEAIKILREAGANINLSDVDEEPPLDIVFGQDWDSNFMLEMIKALVASTPGKSKKAIDSTWSLGSMFLNKLDENFVMQALNILLSAGADVNSEYNFKVSYDNYEWRTPLSLALDNGYNIAANFLRQHGAKK